MKLEGAHLALRRVAHSPHSGDHRQGPCGLCSALLPRHRVIGEKTITVGGKQVSPGMHSGTPTQLAERVAHLCGVGGRVGFMGFMDLRAA